jgi:hypothetical protein
LVFLLLAAVCLCNRTGRASRICSKALTSAREYTLDFLGGETLQILTGGDCRQAVSIFDQTSSGLIC